MDKLRNIFDCLIHTKFHLQFTAENGRNRKAPEPILMGDVIEERTRIYKYIYKKNLL